MSSPRLILLLFLAGCASTSQSEAERMCSAQGLRFVKEAYGVGGLGPVEVAEPKEAPDATGGPVPVSAFASRNEETIGLGNLGTITRRPPRPAPPPPPPPGSEPVLSDVGLEHRTLGRGGSSDGHARFLAPAGAELVLEAVGNVPGYRWQLAIDKPERGRVEFWVRCREDQPPRTIEWTFQLRDGRGRTSAAINRTVACTGKPLPGSAPRVESVTLSETELVRGGKSDGQARYTGTNYPLTLLVRPMPRNSPPLPAAPTAGGLSLGRPEGVRSWFLLSCGRWRFSVRDTFGRESPAVEQTITCGACVPPPS